MLQMIPERISTHKMDKIENLTTVHKEILKLNRETTLLTMG